MRKQYETDAVRIDDTGYQVHCVECGKPFESARSDAAFCSSTCRSRAHRKEAKRQRVIDLALQNVIALCAQMPRKGDSPEFEAANKIIKYISLAVNRVESK